RSPGPLVVDEHHRVVHFHLLPVLEREVPGGDRLTRLLWARHTSKASGGGTLPFAGAAGGMTCAGAAGGTACAGARVANACARAATPCSRAPKPTAGAQMGHRTIRRRLAQDGPRSNDRAPPAARYRPHAAGRARGRRGGSIGHETIDPLSHVWT